MTLTSQIKVALTATETGSNDFGGPIFTPSVNWLMQLTDGVAVNNADLIWVDQRTVNSASNDDIDLAGVLSAPLGGTLTFVELVAVIVINAPKTGDANTTNLTIGAGSNPFVGFLGGTTPTVGPIRPGGMFMIASPNAAGIGTVTAGTGDILRIANSSGAAATYQIAIIGRTA